MDTVSLGPSVTTRRPAAPLGSVKVVTETGEDEGTTRPSRVSRVGRK
jgi:hypothetical protein